MGLPSLGTINELCQTVADYAQVETRTSIASSTSLGLAHAAGARIEDRSLLQLLEA
jgi:hypothetical protein